MRFEGVLFPHPVLKRSDDVQGSYSVTDPDVEIQDKTTITIEHELHNEAINKHLKSGNAVYATEIHCKNTGYREVFACEPSEDKATVQKIQIPKGNLRGVVETLALVVGQKTFDYKYNESWNPDYKGKNFKVLKGMPLAYGGEAKFEVPEEDQEKRGGQSFIEIKVNEENKSGPFDVVLDFDPLVVILSKKDYDLYYTLSKRKENSKIFLSSIALPAISYAIANMDSDTGHTFRDNKWYQAIEAKMQTTAELADLEKDQLHSIKAAQIILKSPLGATLEQMLLSEQQNGAEN